MFTTNAVNAVVIREAGVREAIRKRVMPELTSDVKDAVLWAVELPRLHLVAEPIHEAVVQTLSK